MRRLSGLLRIFCIAILAAAARAADVAPPAASRAAASMKGGPAQIVDYRDSTYGGKVRQLRKDDGHEHNFYYYRDPWNADGSRMLGIQSNLQQQNWRVCLYDDTGAVVHKFDAIGGGGHYDYSPDGKLAYFKLPTGGRGRPETPFEIHVVNLDGSNDRVLFRVPRQQAHFHNLHLSWPRKVNTWFVAGFFPAAASPPGQGAYEPPFDEILLIRLDGTTKYLARTGTVYSAPAGRGRSGDMFWAQTLPRPSADGRRICFNSNRSGTIDLCLLLLDGAGN